MKISNIFFGMLIFLIALCPAHAQNFLDGTWQINTNKIIYQSDTIEVYVRGELDTIYDFSLISYTFNMDSSYTGTAMDGSLISGVWTEDTSYLMIDSAISQYEFINDSVFNLISPFSFYDTLGNVLDAVSILQFAKSTILPPSCMNNNTNIWNGSVSDSWFNGNNWSMNSVPLSCDHVVIPDGTFVTIPSGMNVTCYTLEVHLNATLIQELNSTLKVLCPIN